MLYDEKLAQEFSRRLYDEYNIFAQAIVYPTVPLGTARIRLEPQRPTARRTSSTC